MIANRVACARRRGRRAAERRRTSSWRASMTPTYLRRISETAGHRRGARPRHVHVARDVRDRPACGRRHCRRGRTRDGRHGQVGVGAGAAARSSRRARPGDGVLLLQQRRGRRGARPHPRRSQSCDRRLRRSSRQRHAAHLRSRPDVLYVSTHQYPYYPGTGAAGEVGVGEGKGFTINCPLEVGASARTTGSPLQKSSYRSCGNSSRTWSWSPPASTHTNAIRWPTCA